MRRKALQFSLFYVGSTAPPKQSKLLSVCGYFVGGDWGEAELCIELPAG